MVSIAVLHQGTEDMAKITIKKALGDHVSLPNIYDYDSLKIASSSKSKIVVKDEDGNQIVFQGDNLELHGKNFAGGTVEKVQFIDEDKDQVAIVQGKFALKDLSPTDIIDNFMIFAKGNDTIKGSAKGDILIYGTNAGNDTIKGLGGNDFIQGSGGANKIDGGAGRRDVLSFSWLESSMETHIKGIKVDLDAGKIVNAWGKTDKVSGIEDVRGTHLNDKFVGSDANEYFRGMRGNDTFTGGGGRDVFEFALYHGSDVITDFDPEDDKILFGQVGVLDTYAELQSYMSESGDSVIINFGSGNKIEIRHTALEDLDAGNFRFVQVFE